MFEGTKAFLKGAVEFVGEVAKETTKTASTLGAEVVAAPTEALLGKNAFSDGVREVSGIVNGATDVVVDRVVTPLGKRMAVLPVNQVERATRLVGGAIQATFTDEKEEGLGRMRAAAVGFAIPMLTVGLMEQDDVELVGEFLGLGAGAGADVAGAAAETVADAGASDVAEAVVQAGAPTVPAMAAVTSDAPSSMPSHVSNAVRFGGEDPFGDIRNLITMGHTDLLQDALQDVIDRLSPNAPEQVVHQLRLVQNGDVEMVETALRNAKPFLSGRPVKALVHFS